MSGTAQLNLTRKWRSRTFDEIVGQKLPVRLLKNSLYRGQLFPVYLLSGLRGSGKTSTGRIFATAINCRALEKFQTKPQDHILPCLACDSCLAMQQGNHPDFIEIDAASHTGVDNVRQIIEAASFLPIMGRKKIYLIDEAHMLSKAAFNAFLKILEEPPATALFLLATTDPQKIIETVKSRSFQLFFEPIHVDDLTPHLKHVCDVEKIEYQDDVFRTIVQESEGSARDALNLIERIRLAEGKLTQETVTRALGGVSDKEMIDLFHTITQGSVKTVFEKLQSMGFERHSPLTFWKKMVELVRSLMWLHQDIVHNSYSASVESLHSLLPCYSFALLVDILDQLYKIEAHFIKTSAQAALLENILCKLTQRFSEAGVSTTVQTFEEKKNSVAVAQKSEGVHQVPHNQQATLKKQDDRWAIFLEELAAQNNPLADSIFQQGDFLGYENETLHVRFAKKFEFYYEWLFSNEQIWKPSLERVFGASVVFSPDFSGKNPVQNNSVQSSGVQCKERSVSRPERSSGRTEKASSSTYANIDISDTQKWAKANMLTRIFPGTVRALKE